MNTREDIQRWLVEYLSTKLEVDVEKIDTTLMFDRYGLDSITMTSLAAELGERIGRELDPSLAYDHPTIDALAEHLSRRTHPGLTQAS